MSEHEDEQGGDFEAPELHEPPEGVDPKTGEITEDEAEAEDEPEPAAPQGLSEAQLREIDRKATQAYDAYTKKLNTLLGDAADDLTPCPLCAGAFPAFVYVEQAGRVPPEVVRVVQDYLGFATEIEYAPDPTTRECATCHGEGKTATGSKVATQKTRSCPTCKGYGYEPPPGGQANGHVTLGGVGAPRIDAPEPPIADDRDAWGEPRILPDGRENPNYGKMPQFKIAVEPWGQTAGLGAQDAKAG